MTEAEWLACADPDVLLSALREQASDRKLRLYGVCLLYTSDAADEL